MQENCTYCGDEILTDGIREDDRVFCCQECLDAYAEDAFDYLDQRFDE
jgi:hypothetical protein